MGRRKKAEMEKAKEAEIKEISEEIEEDDEAEEAESAEEAKAQTSKLRLLKVLQILSEKSDEDHHLSTMDIVGLLKKEGIESTRQTVYSDLRTLLDCGYEIEKVRTRVNEYYIRVRDFDMPEIQILLDAVQAANFITPKQTTDFESKIAKLGGAPSAEERKRNSFKFNLNKNSDPSVFYSINEVRQAINLKRKVSFKYFNYDGEKDRVFKTLGGDARTVDAQKAKVYVENPCATVFSDGNYYMIAYNEKHDNLVNYRVDRMVEVKVLEEERYLPDFYLVSTEVKEHLKGMFGMYGGEIVSVVFEITEDLVDVVMDKFGEDVNLVRDEDTGKLRFKAPVQMSPQSMGWMCSFGDKCKVLTPPEVVAEVKEYLASTLAQYDFPLEK